MEQSEELRYPVQAFVDLAKNFSREHFGPLDSERNRFSRIDTRRAALFILD